MAALTLTLTLTLASGTRDRRRRPAASLGGGNGQGHRQQAIGSALVPVDSQAGQPGAAGQNSLYSRGKAFDSQQRQDRHRQRAIQDVLSHCNTSTVHAAEATPNA